VNQAQKLLVSIGSNTTTADQRAQYVTSYKAIVSQVADYVDNSKYNGQTLLGSATGAVAGTPASVINSETGSTKTLSAENMAGLANDMAAMIGSTFTRTAGAADAFGTDPATTVQQTTAAAALQPGAAFSTSLKSVANANNQIGADSNMLDATISFNTSKIDSLNAGLGALIDTDLSKESAKLQALQIKQQLGTQALSMANQAPQSLMSLFK
jgi:flagellin